ncbi:MAG: TolC family protein [Pseudomonadales bacterium]|nr:TolC family protein [Halioglobus sp.]MCP5129945.1 TolC family protein [Pseudomonadales bacterium]
MNILTPILFTLLVLCTSVWTPAYALDANVLELEEARLRALASNPGLAEMQERYEALTHLAPQVSSLPDPVVSLNAMNFPWNSFDVNQEPMTQVQLGVSQMFPFPGKLGLREDVALFEAEAALNSVEEMRLNLDMNVTVTWWEIYFLDRSLETVLRNQALFRQFVKIAQTKYEVGNGLQQDVLLAQLELSKLLNNEIQLKSMRERRLIRLNVLMDVSPDTLAALPVDMPAFSGVIAKEPILHQRALETRPLLKQEQASIEASKSRLALAEKDFYPDFKVGVSYGNREEDDFGRSRKDFLSVMLSVNVPLYAGTKQSEAVKQRSREFAKSKYALIDKRNLVLSSISNSLTEYDQAAEQLYLFGEGILPQARQTVESMLVGYQVNEVDFLNLVRSQVTLLNYELQYWKAFTEINQSVARLAAAVGEENIYE